MVTECVAILAISLCLVVVFIRAGHGDYAASVTPILVVPFVHLLALPVSWWTDSLFPALAPQSVVAFADIAAVVVSCLMIMSFSFHSGYIACQPLHAEESIVSPFDVHSI